MHVYSDEKKRQLYDEYGSFGLYLADQVGGLVIFEFLQIVVSIIRFNKLTTRVH